MLSTCRARPRGEDDEVSWDWLAAGLASPQPCLCHPLGRARHGENDLRHNPSDGEERLAPPSVGQSVQDPVLDRTPISQTASERSSELKLRRRGAITLKVGS